MTQHSQLLAGSGFAPADGQKGDVFAAPSRFPALTRPRPTCIATVGVETASYLRRAILWRTLGVENVHALPTDAFSAPAPDVPAIVIQNVAAPPSWSALLDWAGDRTVIVDVQVAVAMAGRGGNPLSIEMAAGPAAESLAVMCHQENQKVYPQAPAIDIVAAPPVSTGCTVGDRIHAYAPGKIDMGLRAIVADSALDAFVEHTGATVWGVTATARGAALLTCPTPAGGQVTVMDLNTVDRTPEPCGSETVAIHLFLALLGIAPVTFGRFVVPHLRYTDFIDDLRQLAERHRGFAAMEAIGQSVAHRDLHLFKIARQPDLPVVLLSSLVHPYEWAGMYGILRYLRYLLECLDEDRMEAREFLATHQVWWIPCVCPDGFEDRRQQPSAINLISNFPGGWELGAPGTVNWGAFGSPNYLTEVSPISLRGPGPGSQPETQALMSLFHRGGPPIVTLADFHENVGKNNFLHQHETDDGVIPAAFYHADLIEGICQAFAGRFHEQRDKSFYKVDHEADFSIGRQCTWMGYASDHGAKACVIEASGGDCTHYRTIRRTEYAAQMVEQVLGSELGRFYRNPWGEDRTVTLKLRRRPEQVVCRLYDAAGDLLEETAEAAATSVTRTVPSGGCLRVRYVSE